MLVLIAGITGGLGQRLARIAMARGLAVRGLGRNPDSLGPELAEQLESFVKSKSYYDIPALEKAVAGVDAIINAYAPNAILDLDGHLLLLRAAERAGIKIFLASSWSRDWTNISFGEFEHYNNHIAFESQAATTSSIRPVYIFTGLFADLLFTVYGPGRFETSGDRARLQYWGDGNTDKYPWSTTEDAAEWTIDILLYGDGVQAGKGGFFKVRSGVTTIDELAAVYEKVYGTKVEVTREGSHEDLRIELMRLRKEKGRARAIEHMSEAAALIASRGGWENEDVTVLTQFKKPITLEEHFELVGGNL
jgi:NAD(P)-dependent dehydrogenase (short-subunit alcohol dehydrogenase family)